MKALIIQHVASEGPGSLAVFLAKEGVAVRTLCLHRGDPLPADPREGDLILSMGGPMNVYEDGKHPFLAGETGFLREAMRIGVPVLGICLGAQLIARAAGARVYRAAAGERGWSTVSLTEAGREDPVTGVLPETMSVLQWHEDTFDIPAAGSLLASSNVCPHQAFRVARAWGLQFHLEADRKMLADWFDGREEKDEVLRRHDELRRGLEEAAAKLCGALLSQAEKRR